ncbi:Oxygen-dependent choline dehydrogenase [Trichinella spiralis]|uniref:Oxygen-dependent choline dehydrogenase n=1 Tax=Trichinella spiralis TaxID=6334 RepID=A0ABR3K324_TRISP
MGPVTLQEGEESALMIRMKWIETAQKLLAQDSEANSKEESESLRQKLDAINLYNTHLKWQIEVQIETINWLKEKLQRLNFNAKQHQQQQNFEIESQNHIEQQSLSTVDDNSTTADKEADNILDKVPLPEKSREPSALVNGNFL